MGRRASAGRWPRGAQGLAMTHDEALDIARSTYPDHVELAADLIVTATAGRDEGMGASRVAGRLLGGVGPTGLRTPVVVNPVPSLDATMETHDGSTKRPGSGEERVDYAAFGIRTGRRRSGSTWTATSPSPGEG
jgi:hypothetical protein